MIEIHFDLGRKIDPKVLEEEVDKMEARIRETIWNKYGHEDLRRTRDALLRRFREYDLDGTGHLTQAQFSQVIQGFNFADMPRQMECLYKRYDRDGSGNLSYAEFAQGLFAEKGSTSSSNKKPPPTASPLCRELLERVRQAVVTRSGGDFSGLSRSLRILDKNRSASLDGAEVRIGLKNCGVDLSDAEIASLFTFFDRNGDGSISVTEFVRAIRGQMSPWRLELVKLAFRVLDKDRLGIVDFGEMCNAYQVNKHPDVLAGKKTPQQVSDDFVQGLGWDKDGNATISLEEFIDYYNDLSAGIDLDAYFELMIRNAWSIRDDKSPSQSANLRVLVTFDSGVQEIVEVQKDLGLDRKNVRAIEAALLRHGVRNIKKIAIAH